MARRHRSLSYAKALPETGCTKVTVRKRVLLFAGLIMRMENSQLSRPGVGGGGGELRRRTTARLDALRRRDFDMEEQGE